MRGASRTLPAAAVAALLVLSGCAGGGFENENDRLRAVNLQLQRELERVNAQLDLRTREVQVARQQLSGGVQPVEGARPPQLATIAFDRYSGAVDTDGDSVDDIVRVYIQPLDGQGRFLPVSGKATARLVAIPESSPPTVLAERTFGPSEWDAAYRSTFMGTHYTLELDLPQPLPDDLAEATLHVTLTEGETGVAFTQQQVIRITH